MKSPLLIWCICCRHIVVKVSTNIIFTNILPAGAELLHAGSRTDGRTDMPTYISDLREHVWKV